ncbi:MAG: hypothetical protein BWY60_00145 [Actinobacteria bacterium ADurb.Bin346]|nr:MAG: hypothetical protein BWY60_00145 [Actinobacteria bacterium ADurb.Bin346]
MPFFSFAIWSITCGERSSISSEILASTLTAFRTRLEAACISFEFLPVTILPSLNSRAAPQNIPALPFPQISASSALFLAIFTTFLSVTFTPSSSIKRATLSTVSFFSSPMMYSVLYLKYLLISSCIPAFLTTASSVIPKPARFTPMSVGELYIGIFNFFPAIILLIINFKIGKLSTSLL